MAWKHFFSQLPGRPVSVVCDRDLGLMGGVRAHWGRRRPAIHLCEHHLYTRGALALSRDGNFGHGDLLHDLLNEAFKTPEGWALFHRAALDAGGASAAWGRHWNTTMKAQTACRASLPAHYGNGAIEEPLRTLRQAPERRSWTFRKLERMNVLLGLMRLHHNGVDQFHTYTSLIRAHLEGHDGRPGTDWRNIRDPRRSNRRVSVSSLRAWAA